MAAAMNVTYASTVTLVETPGTGVPALAANQTLTQSGFNTSLSLTGSSTPNTKKGVAVTVTLTANVATIDLTALTGANGAVNFSGSKGRIFKFKAPATNGAAITVSKGAANGHTGLGAAFSVKIPPGGEFTWYDGGGGVAVSGTDKTLDLAGTGSTDNLQVECVAGD
jgi:hypothetical protein